MKCPECKSEHIRKNGMRRGKQNHICVSCDRQFVENPKNHRGYSDEIRKTCLKMYLNGMGFRGIERVTGVHHTTIINWVKQVGQLLPNAYDPEVIPEVGELDELETFGEAKPPAEGCRNAPAFVGSKKTKYGAAAIAASDASRVFELCSCDSSRSLQAMYFRLGFRRSQLENI